MCLVGTSAQALSHSSKASTYSAQHLYNAEVAARNAGVRYYASFIAWPDQNTQPPESAVPHGLTWTRLQCHLEDRAGARSCHATSHPPRSRTPAAALPGAARGPATLHRGLRRIRPVAPDMAWGMYAGLNLVAMRILQAWQTVPFLAIWVSLTVIYGFRLWRLQPTILTWAAVTLATGGIIGVQVLKGQQDADYLAEVPLIALMFLVMVWHGRRRLAAHQERLTAMEEVQRISQENLRLLEQQRQFLQNASHELGTPITVALGHAELIEQAATDTEVAADAQVRTGELAQLRVADPPAAPAGFGREPGLPSGGAGDH